MKLQIIIEGEINIMKDVVLFEERRYQKIKKMMNKKDDYFNVEELQNFINIYFKSGEN